MFNSLKTAGSYGELLSKHIPGHDLTDSEREEIKKLQLSREVLQSQIDDVYESCENRFQDNRKALESLEERLKKQDLILEITVQLIAQSGMEGLQVSEAGCNLDVQDHINKAFSLAELVVEKHSKRIQHILESHNIVKSQPSTNELMHTINTSLLDQNKILGIIGNEEKD